MPRRRRYYRRSYGLVKKYSNETYGFLNTLSNPASTQQYWTAFVPSATTLGTRKCKNFTLSIICGNANLLYQFALVYVPEGTNPQALRLGTEAESQILQSTSIYEPNQNVILSGFGGGPDGTSVRIRSRLARNLNSGDALCLIIRPLVTLTADVNFAGQLNYAVTFQ